MSQSPNEHSDLTPKQKQQLRNQKLKELHQHVKEADRVNKELSDLFKKAPPKTPTNKAKLSKEKTSSASSGGAKPLARKKPKKA